MENPLENVRLELLFPGRLPRYRANEFALNLLGKDRLKLPPIIIGIVGVMNHVIRCSATRSSRQRTNALRVRFRLPRGGPRRGDFVETSPLKPLFFNAFFSRACVADMGIFH